MAHLESNVHKVLFWTLQRTWREYHTCYGSAYRSTKTRNIHDLRISLRRLISVIDLIQELHFSKSRKKLRKQLKAELSALRDLRDLQNQEKSLDEQLKAPQIKNSSLSDFKASICEKRKVEQKKVRKYLRALDVDRQSLKVQILGEELLAQSENQNFEKRAHNHLRKFLISRYQCFGQYAHRAKSDSSSSLHQARIQFKNFRYAWDAMESLFPRTKSTQDAMKAEQKLLGQIQDSAVLLQLLLEFFVKAGDPHPDPESRQFLRRIERESEANISRFLSNRTQTLQTIQPNFQLKNRRSTRA